jgi:hypothetical protein
MPSPNKKRQPKEFVSVFWLVAQKTEILEPIPPLQKAAFFYRDI